MADIYIGDRKVNELYVGTQRVYAVDSEPNSVKIGDVVYPFVKLGNLLWTTKNLRLPLHDSSGNNLYKVGSKGTATCGLYYIDKISLLESSVEFSSIPQGWRIPTSEEFVSLVNTYGKSALFDDEDKTKFIQAGDFGSVWGDEQYYKQSSFIVKSSERDEELFYFSLGAGYSDGIKNSSNTSWWSSGNAYYTSLRLVKDA